MRLLVRPLLTSILTTAALLLVAASSLPELLIGSMEQKDNWARRDEGRAHERSRLHREAQTEAGSLQKALETRRREAGELSTLTELRRYLQRYGEAELSLRMFLLWYAALPEEESRGVIDPQVLLSLVYGGRAAQVKLEVQREDSDTPSPEMPIHLRILDDRKRVVHESDFVTARLRTGIRDMEWIDSAYEPLRMDSTVLRVEPRRWVENPEVLPNGYKHSLSRLLLDPELEIHTLYYTIDEELFLETVEDSVYTLYRMGREADLDSWRFPWFGG